MKVKLKLNGKAIKEFLLEHVEKIVFGAVVVCFALIVYRAWGREMYPKGPGGQELTPDVLAGYAGDAREWWEATVPNPEEYKTRDYVEYVNGSRIPIEVNAYEFQAAWDRPIVQQRRKRGVPPLFTVEGLRGTADCGQVSMLVEMSDTGALLPPGGGSTPRTMSSVRTTTAVQGQRWVVITALVRYQEQIETFSEYFQTAQIRNPQTDLPRYLGYLVQRAEVKTSDPNQPLDWSEEFISGTARKEAMTRWGQSRGMAQQVVDPRFVDREQKLTFPLPPLVDRTWDESVVHEPEIPFFSRQSQMFDPRAVPESPEAPENPFDSGLPGGPGYSRPMGGYDRPSMEYDGAGMEYDGRAGGYSEGPRGGYAGPGHVGMGEKYKLFRFFDLNVESGKKYRYRVRLALRNPNLQIEPRYLSPEVLAKKNQIEQEAEKIRASGKPREANAHILRNWQIVESDWTEPTDVIVVPRDSRLLAISVQPPPRTAAEPSGKVLLVSWVKDQGIEAFKEYTVQRGKVANFRGVRFPETKEPPKSPRTPRGEEGYYAQSGPLGAAADQSSLVDYLTDTMVLDMQGGDRIMSGKDRLMRPGAILLLDPDGTMVVRHELDDLAEYTKLTERAEPPQQSGGDYEYDPGMEYDGRMQYDGALDGGLDGRMIRTPRGRRGRD